MKIIIQECVASTMWVYHKDQLIDTEAAGNIDDTQALRWLNSGSAIVVKEPVRKFKRKATEEKPVSEAS